MTEMHVKNSMKAFLEYLISIIKLKLEVIN